MELKRYLQYILVLSILILKKLKTLKNKWSVQFQMLKSNQHCCKKVEWKVDCIVFYSHKSYKQIHQLE